MGNRVAEPQSPSVDELPPLSRNRDFLLLWSGQAISSFGNELSGIAYPLLVLAVTGSAARAGTVGSAELLTMLAMLLPAGAVADRWSRRAVMVVSSLVQLAALGGVSAAIGAGWIPLWLLVAAGALEGAGSAFYIGASRGAVRRVEPAPQLSRALARTQARDQAAAIGGPPSGGALFAVARFLPFGLDAVSFGVAALAAALVRGPLDPPSATPRPSGSPFAGTGLRVGAGLRFVLGHRYLRVVALWAAAVNAVATGMMLLVIVLARSRGAEPSQIGVITATFSAGGLLGALSAPRLIGRYSGRTMVLTASWLLVPCPVAMVLAPSTLLIGVAGAVSVCAIAPVNVILLTRAYELIPHEMQGRGGNAMLLCANSLKWLTPVVFGTMADSWGPVLPILTGAGLYGITAVWLQGRGVLRQLDAPAVPAAGVPG